MTDRQRANVCGQDYCPQNEALVFWSVGGGNLFLHPGCGVIRAAEVAYEKRRADGGTVGQELQPGVAPRRAESTKPGSGSID
jgi:hypothetical protein